MNLKLLPLSVKNLKELREWMDKNVLTTNDAVGIRLKCKITKIRELSYNGPRWNMVRGVQIYYNF